MAIPDIHILNTHLKVEFRVIAYHPYWQYIAAHLGTFIITLSNNLPCTLPGKQEHLIRLRRHESQPAFVIVDAVECISDVM